MPEFSTATILQIVLGLGLLNVWLVRAGTATSYRGGQARSLKDEFGEYGLSEVVFYVVGALKIGSAIALIVGIWVPSVVLPAAAIVAVLMIGALVMHVKVKDPVMKSVPAFLMLVMSVSLCALIVI